MEIVGFGNIFTNCNDSKKKENMESHPGSSDAQIFGLLQDAKIFHSLFFILLLQFSYHMPAVMFLCQRVSL